MNPPKYQWEGEFTYTDHEKELIEKINKFLTRPLSPRWIYYGLYDVPDAKKQRELSNILNKARKDKRQLIKRDLVADDTRTPTIWKSNKNLSDFLEKLVYSRNVWQDQPSYIEVWMEDQASLESIVKSPKKIFQKYKINARYCKGFTSLGAMWEAYKFFKDLGENKPIKILYYGDLNPSGWAIPLIIVRQFKEMGLKIKLLRRALDPGQLKKYNIPEYSKVSGDPRRPEFNRIFGYEHWEAEPLQKYRDERTGKTKEGKQHLNIDLEKVPIKRFETMLKNDIKRHMDLAALKATKEKEADEDDALYSLINKYDR